MGGDRQWRGVTTRDGVARIGNSLVVGKRTERPLITLFGHLDTVPEQEGNGTPRITDDRIYGLGATDVKAGLAVMIHLLDNPRILSGRYDVVGVFYDKEEGPSAENGLEDVLNAVGEAHRRLGDAERAMAAWRGWMVPPPVIWLNV